MRQHVICSTRRTLQMSNYSCTAVMHCKKSHSILPPLPATQRKHYRAFCQHYTHPFNGPLSGSTRVSQYQKGKTDPDFTGARDSEWQWHQLGHMQVCTSLQTDNHASTSLHKFFTGQMPFLLPDQQCQSSVSFSTAKTNSMSHLKHKNIIIQRNTLTD